MTQYNIDEEHFREKITRLYGHWSDHQRDLWQGVSAFHVAVGRISADSMADLKSTALHSWLLGYEFPETMLLFTRHTIHMLTNKKKADIVTPLKETYNEKRSADMPALVLVVMGRMKDSSTAEANTKHMKDLVASLSGSAIGTFTEESQSALESSALAKLWDTCVKEKFNTEGAVVDIEDAMSDILVHKSAAEMTYIEKSSTYTCRVMQKFLTQELETIIDENKQVTHRTLADETENVIFDPTQQSFSNALKKLKNDDMDVAFSPIVQSGGSYNMDPHANPLEANSNKALHFGTITVEFGAKYRSYNSRLGRTYMVNSTNQQETYYKFLSDLKDHIIDRLRVGARLCDVYNSCISKITSSHPELMEHFPKSIGWGIGLEQYEKHLEINQENDAIVDRGMVFVVRVSLANVKEEETKGDPKRTIYSLLLTDTVAVPLDEEKGNRAISFTKLSDYQYGDVSYALDASEDGSGDENEEEHRDDVDGGSDVEIVSLPRTRQRRQRGKTNEDPDRISEGKRRELQEQIQEKKHIEWQKSQEEGRDLSDDEGDSASANKDKRGHVKQSMVEKLAYGQLVSYGGIHEFPINPSTFSGHSRKKIVVDETKETVLLPIGNNYVPFHISTIKNLAKSDEGMYMTLRINFKSSGAHFGQEYTPAKQFPSSVFVKEISYRAKDPKNLTQVMRVINELLRRVKQREKDKNERLVTQDKLILTKRGPNSFVPRLKDVNMRPTPKGRKINGTLEAHDNGFRYLSTTGDAIDIIYDNIRYAFLQEARNDTMVLIHFHLRDAIMIGKKKVKDMQFYTDVIEEYDHLTGRWRSNMSDRESIEEEERERRMKKKLNEEFSRFCDKVCDKNPDMSFDEPYREQEFVGTPHKSSVALAPTNNCLVSLSEFPPFVMPLDDVELTRFERVSHGIRNFDLVFVPKDYSKQAQIVNSIPIEKIDGIKDWLNRCEVVYYEGPVPLNWKKTLETLKADKRWQPWDPVEGWASILDLDRSDDENEEEMEGEVMEDEYVPSDDEDVYDDADDDEDDDEFSRYVEDDDEDDESDFDDGLDSDEEEGKSWEELEKEASRADENRKDRAGKWSDDEDSQPRKKRRR